MCVLVCFRRCFTNAINLEMTTLLPTLLWRQLLAARYPAKWNVNREREGTSAGKATPLVWPLKELVRFRKRLRQNAKVGNSTADFSPQKLKWISWWNTALLWCYRKKYVSCGSLRWLIFVAKMVGKGTRYLTKIYADDMKWRTLPVSWDYCLYMSNQISCVLIFSITTDGQFHLGSPCEIFGVFFVTPRSLI